MEMRCLYKKYQCNMQNIEFFRICRQSFALTNPNEQWDLQTHCLKLKILQNNGKRVYLASKNVSSCEKGFFLDANDSGKLT